ncbi:MAG: tetratricopeptide repeat protein [Nitrospirae bacterium]|nr:tetratricopeptide repeat protein [Nitrospirota bacterium]
MIDKILVTKKAQEYTAKGEIDKAIAEWQKLLSDGKDGSIHNIIGDLHLRIQEKGRAIDAFKKAADAFRKDGFYLKAIAIYKKILNIDPLDTISLISLGELNSEKGLTGNANENFRAAIDIFVKANETVKALDIYKKMLKLSPNAISLIREVAEFSHKAGLTADAVNEYLKIAEYYIERGEYNEAERFYSIVTNLTSQSSKAFIGLSRIAGLQDNPKEAFGYLKDALSIEPDNNDILLDYARLAIELGDIAAVREALSTLDRLELSEPLKEKVAEMKGLIGEEPTFTKEDNAPAAGEGIYEPANEGIEDKAGSIEEEPAEAIGALHETPSTTEAHFIPSGTLEESLSEAEFYMQQGLKEEAIKVFERLLSIFPDNEEISKKLIALRYTSDAPVAKEAASKIEAVIQTEDKPKPKKGRISYI